jgi:hypothetical protein
MNFAPERYHALWAQSSNTMIDIPSSGSLDRHKKGSSFLTLFTENASSMIMLQKV